MSQTPARSRLTPIRRSVLYLKAAGWSYAMIGAKLGIPDNRVRKHLIAVNETLLPGITDGQEPSKGYRVVYALGLLDAGVPPEEVPAYLAALVTKAEWIGQKGGGPLGRAHEEPDPGTVAE